MKRNKHNPKAIESLLSYTSDDFEEILKSAPLNKDGYPDRIPLKNRMANNVLLKFVDSSILDCHGNKQGEPVSFDILEKESFQTADPLWETKLDFLMALFSKNRTLSGALYLRGKYIRNKNKAAFKTSLILFFMSHYFKSEDVPFLKGSYQKMEGGRLPYLPTDTKDGKKIIFQADDATVRDKKTKALAKTNYSFTVLKGYHFDLKDEEDLEKITVIKSLLSEFKTVDGFYYKGKLLSGILKKDYRLYLEKSFIKKNFTIEDKDYILMNFTKDSKTGYPLFFPMSDKENHPISISVLNADVKLIGCRDIYANFHIKGDRSFHPSDEESKTKLKIIQDLFFKKSILTGALYLDGMLISSNLSKNEIERRRIKAENASGIFLDDNEDFVRIHSRFTTEDRFSLLKLTDFFDEYYPDNITHIPNRLKPMKSTNILVRFDHVNVIDEDGNYVFDHDLSMDFEKEDTYNKKRSEAFDYLVRALFSKDVKIRGAIYYRGYNILSSRIRKKNFLHAFIEKTVDASLIKEAKEHPIQFYKYQLDKKTGMLKYFPTSDKNGRETLLSVVNANICFGLGKKIVKASENLNFDVYVGETFGLVGESGSGKTTISRAILNINHLTKGGIYYKGKLISTSLKKNEMKSIRKSIQMIFQDPAASLNERANIDYIVSEGLYNFHLFKTKEERIEKVTEMMEAVGLLPEHLSRYPHEFSGGQRQRIGIARALVIEPELVLADEPISALDVSIRAQVLNLLRKLQKEKSLTYLFIAHDLSIIRYISDRIAVMHQGHIVELGTAEEIYSNPIHPYTKALLTAIPQPDPMTKDIRKRLVYEKGNLDYEKCQWLLANPGHYVLATEELLEKWQSKDFQNS